MSCVTYGLYLNKAMDIIKNKTNTTSGLTLDTLCLQFLLLEGLGTDPTGTHCARVTLVSLSQ